jgi:hypothetical protein
MTASAREMAHVEFDEAKRKRLRKAHNRAIKVGNRSFIFDELEYDTRYAGYLLEYLDMKMKPQPRSNQ